MSAIRLKPAFRHVVGSKPDLYGPFWIASTLVVIIVASSSLINFFADSTKQYDFDQIPVAASLVLFCRILDLRDLLWLPIHHRPDGENLRRDSISS